MERSTFWRYVKGQSSPTRPKEVTVRPFVGKKERHFTKLRIGSRRKTLSYDPRAEKEGGDRAEAKITQYTHSTECAVIFALPSKAIH